MLHCPYCHGEIRLRELPYQGYFKSLRICPGCGGKFTVDRDTKLRQALFICAALMSLLLTVLLYVVGAEWLFPSLFSYAVLALLIGWGHRRVRLVKYDDGESRD